MKTGDWKRKWAAFRQELARRQVAPRLSVKPKRSSGEHVTPRNWHEPEQQAKLFGLPLCTDCRRAIIVGVEGLIEGKWCHRCSEKRQSQGPSAA